METQNEVSPIQGSASVEQPAATKGSSRSGTLLALFAAAVVVKLVLMSLFSSGFEDELFLPFVHHFLSTFDDPWSYFYQQNVHLDAFPYQPLMLYILSLACAPLQLLGSAGWDSPICRSFFFKLPTLLSDIAIAVCLLKLFPNKQKQVFWFYFASPIILYACYLHSQVDLIPTAFLFGSIYSLRRKRMIPGAVLFGCSMATKLHVVAALPIILLYMFRNQGWRTTAAFAGISAAVAAFFVAPFLGSTGFQHMVLSNPKQHQVLEVYAQIGDLRLYIPILAGLVTYGRFCLYAKINTDLFDSFLTLIFSVFVLTIMPAPGWYVWTAPFLSMFMVKYFNKHRHLLAPFAFTNAAYLLFFIVFHRSDHLDLAFLNHAIQFQQFDISKQSLVFTMLEAGLLAMIIFCYRAGIKSNSIYRRDYAFVIGIGGDSGAGKSTLLSDIKQLLQGRVVEVEGDGDHKWQRGDENWSKYTHLDPKANWLHRQAETILNLKRGGSVKRAEYDHGTGQFTTARPVHADDFIVLSGLHAFYLPKMRKLVDLKIFMDPAQDVQTHWKVVRDTQERGYSSSQVVEQIERRKQDRMKYIVPQREHADLLVHYFSSKQFRPDAPESAPELCLSITLSSSIRLEDFLQTMTDLGIVTFWDYDSSLSKQQVIFAKPVPAEMLPKLASELVPNLDELLQYKIAWAEEFRGTLQLILLLVLSELMKEKDAT